VGKNTLFFFQKTPYIFRFLDKFPLFLLAFEAGKPEKTLMEEPRWQ